MLTALLTLTALCVTLAGAVAISSGVAGAADDTVVRREIQFVYDRADAAAVAARTLADLDAIHESLDTPDCVFADFGQPPRRWREMREYVAEGLRTHLTSFRSQIVSIDVQSLYVTATTLVRGVAHRADAEGRFGPKDTIHEIETTATVRDVWVKTTVLRSGAPLSLQQHTDHSWRRKSHEKTVPNRITAVDGKPMP